MRRSRAGEKPAEGESQLHVDAARLEGSEGSWFICVELVESGILVVLKTNR